MSEQDPSRSARVRAVSVLELATNILIHLDFLTLLRARLVCRAWKSVIDRNPSLQENLFLSPAPRDSNSSINWKNTSALTNPWKFRSVTVQRYTETYTIAILHPWLEKDHVREKRGVLCFTMPCWQRALELKSEGLWRGMYITQPPCRSIIVEYEICTPTSSCAGRIPVQDPDGLKLEQLVEEIAALLSQAYLGPNVEVLVREVNAGLVAGARFTRLDFSIHGFLSPQSAFHQQVLSSTFRPAGSAIGMA